MKITNNPEQELDRLVVQALKSTGRSANEIINYAARKCVADAQDITIRGAGRRKGAGLAGSKQAAKREHLAFLEEWIRQKRRKRCGQFLHGRFRWKERSSYIPKKEIAAYLRGAKRRQGELAAGWNAAAIALGLKPPAWVKRHGNTHGAFRKIPLRGSVIALEVAWNGPKTASHGNMKVFAEMALKNANYALKNTAPKFLAKNIDKANRAILR